MKSKRTYKKNKKESFSSKIVNFILTILVACAISSQVCTAANNNLRIAQISDAHFSSFEKNTSYKFLEKSGSLLDDAIFQVNTSGPYDFVVFTGDLVNVPRTSELDKFIQRATKLSCSWYAVDGNHDISIDGDLTKKYFFSTLSKASKSMRTEKPYYAFTPKHGFRVLCLDSIIDSKLTSNGEYYKEEMDWIKEELDSHKKDVVILCTHVPVYEPYSSPNHRLKNSDEVKTLLRRYSNPIIILQGHYHGTKARQDGNIVWISTPSLVTFPNSFRVINIKSGKKQVEVDVFLKETRLKDIQSRSKLRILGSESLYGEESDRNAKFVVKK